MLTRNQVFGVKPRLGSLEVPEWGGTVALRPIGPLALAEIHDDTERRRTAVVMVREGVATPDGAPMFTAADDAWLAAQPWDLMLRIATAVSEHSGITAPAGTAGNGTAESAAGN